MAESRKISLCDQMLDKAANDSDEELENLRQAALRTWKSRKTRVQAPPPEVITHHNVLHKNPWFKRRNGSIKNSHSRSNLIVINPIRVDTVDSPSYSVPLPQNKYFTPKQASHSPARRKGPSRFRYDTSSDSSSSESDFEEKDEKDVQSGDDDVNDLPAADNPTDLPDEPASPTPQSSSPGIRSVIICPESANHAAVQRHKTRIPVHLRLGSPLQRASNSSHESSPEEPRFNRIESVVKTANDSDSNYLQKKRSNPDGNCASSHPKTAKYYKEDEF